MSYTSIQPNAHLIESITARELGALDLVSLHISEATGACHTHYTDITLDRTGWQQVVDALATAGVVAQEVSA